MDHVEHCDLLELEVGRFAKAIAAGTPDAAVPGCPDWTLADLASHLGTVHRWAEHLVRVRARARIPWDDVPFDRVPPTAAWLGAGGQQLVSTLRASDPEWPMWAWGKDQHVRFWSRRQLHETLVHRLDVEEATGVPSEAEPTMCADGVDELLANLPTAAYFSPDVVDLRGSGERLQFVAADTGDAWTVTLTPDGFDVDKTDKTDKSPVPSQAILAAPALDLLLVLYRRRPPAGPAVTVEGDSGLVDFWLAGSALQ